eukprot:Skav220365  [mRNA]  locus=scaffold609:109230:111324:+ [translate_table: standard]
MVAGIAIANQTTHSEQPSAKPLGPGADETPVTLEIPEEDEARDAIHGCGTSESVDEIPWHQSICQSIIEHWSFEKGIGLVIVINSIMLGVETELAIQNKPTAWPADLVTWHLKY